MTLNVVLKSGSVGKVLIVVPYDQRCLYLGHSLIGTRYCENSSIIAYFLEVKTFTNLYGSQHSFIQSED